MVTPIPKYLEKNIIVEKTSDSFVLLKIKCICENNKFSVFKNKINIQEKRKIDDFNKRLNPWRTVSSYFDKKDGKEYMVQRNSLGVITAKIPAEEVLKYKIINIIKCKCCNCGKEFVVFDNRIHGYDASTEKNIINNNYTDIVFQEKVKFAIVFVKVMNNLTFKEFNEEIDSKLDYETYTNAFSDITITAYSLGKKRTILSEETS